MNKSKLVIFSILMATVLSMTISTASFQVQAQTSQFVRIGITGDVDCNSDQKKQFDLLVKYHVDLFFSGGDYGYTNGQCVLDDLTARGFTQDNSAIACGNHDSCSQLRTWLGMDKNYGSKHFIDGKIDAIMIDGNSNFGSGSTQFNAIKDQIESSDAWYKFAIIHQPFATAKSNHGPNGQFSTYQPIFADNDVNVIEAHNHNYQRFLIGDTPYWLVGTGLHDKGSAMYGITSSSFQGNPLLFGNDNKNGILLLDVQIDNASVRNIQGTFVTDSEEVLDTFTVGSTPPEPPVCKPDEHLENGQCVPNPPTEPPSNQTEVEATVMKVTASTFQAGTTNTPDKTIDGDLATRWSADGDPQSITYEFDKAYNISKVGIAFYKGDARTADFEIGGQQFTSSGSSLQLQNFTVVNNETNTMTIIGHGNSDNNWNSFTEVEFYATTNATPPPPVEEICGNGIDDDGDGLIDEDCPPPPPPPPSNETFTVDVGNGTALFVPSNQTLNSNTTVAINEGIAILPKP